MHPQICPACLQQFFHKLHYRCGLSGGGGHEIIIICQPPGGAVIKHHPVIPQHHPITCPADRQFSKGVDVEPVKKFSRIWPLYSDFA